MSTAPTPQPAPTSEPGAGTVASAAAASPSAPPPVRSEPPKSGQRPSARSDRTGTAIVGLLSVLLLSLVMWRAMGHVEFAQGLELLAVEMAHEVGAGGSLDVETEWQPSRALDADYTLFLHAEPARKDSGGCHAVQSAEPSPPSSRWSHEPVRVRGSLRFPADCAAGTISLYAGLYRRRGADSSQARLKILAPERPDRRIYLGSVEVLEEGAETALQRSTAFGMRLSEYGTLLAPWWAWLVGIGTAGIVALLLRMRAPSVESEARDASAHAGLPRWLRVLSFALPALPFFLGVLVGLEFVKDDAYISFRYAHNLVTGHGFVFNRGERLEGITNFLWALLLAPFEALQLDLFQVCEVLGTLLGLTCLIVTTQLTAWLHAERRSLVQLWGAMWLASSSSFAMWTKGGLEQPLASLLPIASALLLWRAREALTQTETAREPGPQQRRYLAAGLLMGAGCLTRPELHLLAMLVALPLLVDALRRRGIARAEWLYVAGVLGVALPCHAFRYLYYGTLIPNTFYVKTATGALVWRDGLNFLRELFDFNLTGALVVLAPLAFVTRRRLLEKATMALIALSFMAYYVKVGADEMQWHRLYLAVLPFLCVLAALGLSNLLEGSARVVRAESDKARLAVHGLGWVVVLLACWNSWEFTYREMHGFDGHGDLAGTFHPDLGKFLVRHERPGGLVAFQDVGSTPYHAPDINFLDFIGLVDRTVAHARHDYGLHAFLGADPEGVRPKYDADMREYFFRRAPEWAILTIYPPKGTEQTIATAFDQDPTGAGLGPWYRYNGFQFGLWDDPRFRRNYVPVRTWQRSRGYYLALWRRRDLWEQTPREVVLEALPKGVGGTWARLEGGLTMMGAAHTRETLDRHEVVVTTWWQLPGPMPHDLMFFVHLEKPHVRVGGDHVPGDWMWPADRWQKGSFIEDRTLLQLPAFVTTPGTYELYLGVYRRSTGERVKIIAGSNAGDNRIPLGRVEVKALQPLVDHLIPPTRVEVMRKYPERIVDSRRAPGT